MSRRKLIKEELEEEIGEAEVITHWSPKRIGIAIFVLVLLVGGSIYVLSLLSQNPNILGERITNRPQIKIPNERDVGKILDNAQDELSNINARNIIESQPRIKKIIDDLTGLTSSSTSAKSLICDSLCK